MLKATFKKGVELKMTVEVQKDQIIEGLQQVFDDYGAAKTAANELDFLLGFRCQEVEEQVFQGQDEEDFSTTQQFWYGLDVQSLQTPYSELKDMVDYVKPQPGDVWIDYGAGYGRLGVTLGFLYPWVIFKGYEYVSGRVVEGQRIFQNWGLDPQRLVVADIADENFWIEPAQIYFIYDFGSKRDVYRILEKLKKRAFTEKIQVIARGKGVRNWILMDHPWLSLSYSSPRYESWSLFSSF